MSTPLRPFPISALHVVEAKLAEAEARASESVARVAELEAILARTVRANADADTPLDAANGMVTELKRWDGYTRENEIAFAGLTRADFVLFGAAS